MIYQSVCVFFLFAPFPLAQGVAASHAAGKVISGVMDDIIRTIITSVIREMLDNLVERLVSLVARHICWYALCRQTLLGLARVQRTLRYHEQVSFIWLAA